MHDPTQTKQQSLIIRPAEPADLRALLSWFPTADLLLLWGGPQLAFPLDQRQLDRMLEESQRAPAARLIWSGLMGGAEDRAAGATVIAHGQAVMDYDRRAARLARIGLAPGWRGRGLGRALLLRILNDLAARSDIDAIGLNVYTFNQPAIRLYESLGFRPEPDLQPPIQIGSQIWQAQAMSRPNRPVSGPD